MKFGEGEKILIVKIAEKAEDERLSESTAYKMIQGI